MKLRSLANVAALVAVLWLNGLAGSGGLSGESIGLIANRYPSTFLPANYVFGIWGLIYVSLLGAILFQLVPRRDAAFERIGWWWVASCALNIGWIVVFSFSLFGTALLLMAALLATLAVIYGRIRVGASLALVEQIAVGLPFSLYLAWISVAIIANAFQYVTYLQWSGPGSAPVWSAVMMVVATVGAVAMVVWRGDWVFPCVTAWAFAGIADRYADVALIATTATACVAAGFVGALVALAYRRTRRRVPVASAVAAAVAAMAAGALGVAVLPPPSAVHAAQTPASFLFLWAGDADEKDTDFLAVVDADPNSPGYGDLVATVPVGASTGAHHTEHTMPEGGMLFANGFPSGRSFVFDVREPLHPELHAEFTSAGELNHPHSFERLPNGNVLATFQRAGEGNVRTGGLVELTPEGAVVRTASAERAGNDPRIRPYSLAILPELDRVVTTTADMMGKELDNPYVQVWRLSDLELLSTLTLPEAERSDDPYWSAEPRLLGDGSVMISTFLCGLYRMTGVETEAPQIAHVYSLPRSEGTECALPVVAGRWWVHTVPADAALVTLDLADPAAPVEVARLSFGEGAVTHWISLDEATDRIVLTGYGTLQHSARIVHLDRATGALRLDEAFDFRSDRESWPHGETGPAIPHGALFSRAH